ncbi:hypothetical protein GGF46_002450 [Coemansia sp. RSA 552]|nr:hypothetical protein GGF46_002450 [Coemansia sp. RSA 552]
MFDTRVLSAKTTQIAFTSMEDGAFTATGQATGWVDECRQVLRSNQCVGLPTETVYGLAANALDASAVKSIFAAKGRPSDNPLIVHVSSIRMLRALYHLPESLAALPFLGTDNAALEGGLHQALGDEGWPEIPAVYHDAIRRFWPGPLTLIMPRPACIPMEVLGGHGDTVAMRFPSHPVARAAISACGLPLAAPSANASGRPSPTLAAHVQHDLAGRIPLIVDAGPCDVGVESTVLDAYSAHAHTADGQLVPCILRPGGITYEQLQSLGGPYANLRVYRRDFTDAALEAAPTTPGMKYRHYSPTAPVHLVAPAPAAAQLHQMQKFLDEHPELAKVGIVTVGGDGKSLRAEESQLVVHTVADARDLAHRIFALLRQLDEDEHVDAILVQGVDDANEGLAVMNRLNKAASHHIAC